MECLENMEQCNIQIMGKKQTILVDIVKRSFRGHDLHPGFVDAFILTVSFFSYRIKESSN